MCLFYCANNPARFVDLSGQVSPSQFCRVAFVACKEDRTVPPCPCAHGADQAGLGHVTTSADAACECALDDDDEPPAVPGSRKLALESFPVTGHGREEVVGGLALDHGGVRYLRRNRGDGILLRRLSISDNMLSLDLFFDSMSREIGDGHGLGLREGTDGLDERAHCHARLAQRGGVALLVRTGKEAPEEGFSAKRSQSSPKASLWRADMQLTEDRQVEAATFLMD